MKAAYSIRRFQPERDLDRLEAYLRQRWQESRKPVSWLPQRLHDLYYRMGAMEADEGRPRSTDYIFLWERGGEIAACLLPDGENIYFSQKPGHEALFPAMLAYAEQIGRAMMQAALRRCAELGLEKCYVESFGWRRDFYAAAGFTLEDSVSFWSRMLPADPAQPGCCRD